MQHPITIRSLTELDEADLVGLSEVLIDCVQGGASVSFMLPIGLAKAKTYWREVAISLARGERIVLVAEEAGTLLGTVQIILVQPENQPHRADLAKLLVHRRARQRGIGQALLIAAEEAALQAGKTLLVLDTASAEAERLYQRQGWQRCGIIPDYALLPDGPPCATVIYYKSLD